MLLGPRYICNKNRINFLYVNFVRYYSRRNNTKKSVSLITINDTNNDTDLNNAILETSLNWELFAPYGYKFCLPGNIGLACFDLSFPIHIDEINLEKNKNQFIGTLQWMVNECPVLLKEEIINLFPGTNLYSSQIAMLIMIPKMINENKDDPHTDTLKMAKYFILAAKDVCNKLKLAGYWADFINPFSGRPYMSNIYNPNIIDFDLSGADPQNAIISRKGNCIVITPKIETNVKSLFEGRVFTNAPANIVKISEIINKID